VGAPAPAAPPVDPPLCTLHGVLRFIRVLGGLMKGLANLRLTVGSGSLRLISRPFFFFIFNNFFLFSDFGNFFVREILEREIFLTKKSLKQKFERQKLRNFEKKNFTFRTKKLV
jgi:hypothetical protein